ncbi:hypothetical protein [Nocardia farcinica]|uniref:hypothetical protein n=1 Tax=Nocardia farcinica TaxID=37329 RepID=UPI001895AEA0|nr:hypothetical protein [Nocardia farcinica]MBF6271416.1 hypothetical protein [Nocardia farcinica]MBF6372881.1 hypothetical protein [Nocardia farcinica]
MTRFLAALAGALLVAAVALIFAPAALPALVLVVLSWWFRSAAVGAVLLTVAVLALAADIGVVEAAATGLVATAYLLNAATVAAPASVVPTTLPSVLGAVGGTACAATAAVLPLHLAWLPALAPVAVIALYAVLVPTLTPRPTQEAAPSTRRE